MKTRTTKKASARVPTNAPEISDAPKTTNVPEMLDSLETFRATERVDETEIANAPETLDLSEFDEFDTFGEIEDDSQLDSLMDLIFFKPKSKLSKSDIALKEKIFSRFLKEEMPKKNDKREKNRNGKNPLPQKQSEEKALSS